MISVQIEKTPRMALAVGIMAVLLYAFSAAPLNVYAQATDAFCQNSEISIEIRRQTGCTEEQIGLPSSSTTGDVDDDIPFETDYSATNCSATQLNNQNCGIVKWINIFINALTAVFGIIAIIMIAVGGVQYSFARDNPQQAAAAKERIRNVVIAIVAYVFLYGFLQYVIPGGIL